MRPLAGGVPPPQRRENRRRRVQPAHHIRYGDPDFRGISIGMAGYTHDPAARLNQKVVAGLVFCLAGSEARYRAVHEAGIFLP